MNVGNSAIKAYVWYGWSLMESAGFGSRKGNMIGILWCSRQKVSGALKKHGLTQCG
jgi:hypothetical protein